MQILTYDEVDPLQVLQLSLLALDFPLTPERAAHIRRTDPRPFPCFTVHAVEDGMVAGQVGVFRLPMVSIEGREDAGGVWAVSAHPQYAGRGVATALLDEAHNRMRAAGLRFSTLGTSRSGRAYRLYERLGYVDMHAWATALARWETAHQPTRLSARPPDPGGYDYIEDLFTEIARDYLGFSWRHTPFARLRDRVPLDEIWILWENHAPVGYVFASTSGPLVKISLQALRPEVRAAEAVAAVAAKLPATYVQVTMTRPADMDGLRQAGWQVAHPTWGAFMVKPLVPGLTAEDARRLYGIGSDSFLISWLDTT